MDPAKRRAWVLYQLKLRGESLASLARRLGVDRTTPGYALRKPYPRMERAIAEAVEVPVHVLFPERYTATGERLIRMGAPKKSNDMTKHNTRTNGRNVEREAVA